ncbi:hypothetical protein GPECTOR_193g318 [Gonium pectorale]|uniref:Protein kinase domain-containing protein n=1 Tax=Gonium pectorale TaxID=33097 RepID=A0A150FX25_GONPE|nr:hypothetical protein GPECTOR_193g318 [Gonium pectorale]|eukprot:KXZ42161.1 hypothetical protein GPECTOR_193g318 [Gonium pectorale]
MSFKSTVDIAVVFIVIMVTLVKPIAAGLTITCSSGAQLAAAMASPDVDTVFLPVDVALHNQDWDALVVLHHNFTVMGTAKRPVTLDMNFVRGKVRLSHGVTLAFHNLVLANFRAGSLMQSPGLDLLLPLPPGQTALIRVDRGALAFRVCFPLELASPGSAPAHSASKAQAPQLPTKAQDHLHLPACPHHHHHAPAPLSHPHHAFLSETYSTALSGGSEVGALAADSSLLTMPTSTQDAAALAAAPAVGNTTSSSCCSGGGRISDAASYASQRAAAQGGVAGSQDPAGAEVDVEGQGGEEEPPVPVTLLPTVLGRGAFGRVYEGLYKGELVAVKVVHTNDLAGAYSSWVAPAGVPTLSHPPESPAVEGGSAPEVQSATAQAQASATGSSSANSWSREAAAAGAVATESLERISETHQMDFADERTDTGLGSVRSPSDGPMGRQGDGSSTGPARDALDPERQLRLFASEVAVLGRCDHPNVVRLLAACLTPPRLCLVMERCETSLERLVYGGGGGPRDAGPPVPAYSVGLIPLPKLLHIAIQICQGLEYLHPLVVHRDLKPANVLINGADTDRPVAKLADFGLSRIRANTLPTVHPEAGTPAYVAPECYDLANNVVTHHADMYALGVLLWAMLTGEEPWKDLSVYAVACKVAVLGERLPLEHLSPRRCPPKLKRLLQQCWEADPLRRPAAAEAVKQLMLVQQQVAMSYSCSGDKGGVGADAAAGLPRRSRTSTCSSSGGGQVDDQCGGAGSPGSGTSPLTLGRRTAERERGLRPDALILAAAAAAATAAAATAATAAPGRPPQAHAPRRPE